MSVLDLQKITDQLLNLPEGDVDFILSQYFSKKKTRTSKKIVSKKSDIPLREATPEELEAITEFEKNPELIGVEKSTKFLEDLKIFANTKSK